MTRNRRREKEFYEMLNSCQGVILSICCSFAGRGTPDADDLYQEILVNLWVGMHTYRGESDIKTWVHVVALNTARMYRRRQKKERVGNTGLISQMLSDSLAAGGRFGTRTDRHHVQTDRPARRGRENDYLPLHRQGEGETDSQRHRQECGCSETGHTQNKEQIKNAI